MEEERQQAKFRGFFRRFVGICSIFIQIRIAPIEIIIIITITITIINTIIISEDEPKTAENEERSISKPKIESR